MDFPDRLEQAIERGKQVGRAKADAAAEQAVTQQELQRLHSQYRLTLSERIERCLAQLVDHFPGFRFETIVDERGWGAAISRDDLILRSGGGRNSSYSRLEMVIRPISQYFLLELSAKGTVDNRELFNRSQYQRLADVHLPAFVDMIDNWALEYAEAYAAKNERRNTK